jgi:hypothetical protein
MTKTKRGVQWKTEVLPLPLRVTKKKWLGFGIGIGILRERGAVAVDGWWPVAAEISAPPS